MVKIWPKTSVTMNLKGVGGTHSRSVISNKIAKQMGISLGRMDVDRRGTMLADEVEQPFSDIRMAIEVETDASPDQMAALQADLAKFCPIAKVLRGSGVTITETWATKPLSKDPT